MIFRDTTNEISSTASNQEITTTAANTVEHNPITSKPSVDEADTTPTHLPTTAEEEKSASSSPAMKTTTAVTLPDITPAVMTDSFEGPTLPLVDNNIQGMDTATTTPVAMATAMTSSMTTMPSVENISEILKQPEEMVSVVVTSAPATGEGVTMQPDVSATVAEDSKTNVPLFTDLFKQPDEPVSVTVAEDSKTNPVLSVTDLFKLPNGESAAGDEEGNILSMLSPVFTETGGDPALSSNAVMHEVDNVLTMSSNEDTTRLVSSTDSKIDNSDKPVVALAVQTEPTKQQETKTEADGNSGGNAISTSFVVLSMTVLYVIV